MSSDPDAIYSEISPETLDSQDCDDSEKTNVTVIDSTLEIPQDVGCEQSVSDTKESTVSEDIIDWELPELMSDLNVMHEQMKSRILKEMVRTREKAENTTSSLMKQERQASYKREELLQSEVSKLQAEISEQNKALEHKDDVIKKLVAEIRQQKERVKLAQVFANWRSHEEYRKRQKFCSKMATKHADLLQQRRALQGWKSLLETTWKQRVESTCRAKAEEVCLRLASEYEEKTKKLTSEVHQLSQRLQQREEKQQQEKEELRAALMRGVCALNLETMGVMHDSSDDQTTVSSDVEVVTDGDHREEQERNVIGVAKQRVTARSMLRRPMGCGEVIGSRSGSRHRLIAGQEDVVRSPNPSAAVPILVERHHPVNKRTAANVLASHERLRVVPHQPL